MNAYTYKVAGLPLAVHLPQGWKAAEWLPSFEPFRCEPCPEEEWICRLTVKPQPWANDGGKEKEEWLGESVNDMGHLRLWRSSAGYRVEMRFGTHPLHVMEVNTAFTHAAAYVEPSDKFLPAVLSAMLRIVYAQAVIGRNGLSMHASAVVLGGKGYLFLGKSGTGKSTHARQWLEAFSDCSLLNDDNPVVRMEGNAVAAYGTPWSGKTPCYKNERYPVAGIVRLRQASANRFTPFTGTEAFAALLPSCSAIRQDERLQDTLCGTLIEIAERIPIGLMECLPNLEAASVAFEGIKN